MDYRDKTTWVTLELTSLGEIKVEEGILTKILCKEMGVSQTHPIFIPTAQYDQNGRKISLHLMEGYVFIATGLEEQIYFDLEKTPYVEQVFSSMSPTSGLKTLQVISNQYIEEMRNSIRGMSCQSLKVGNRVLIVKGAYRLLEGSIVGFEGENAYVSVVLRSLSVIVTLPKVFLDLLSEEGNEND